MSDDADEPGFTKITIIDCIEDEVLEEKLIRSSNGYIYDTINDQIYFHTNFPDGNDNVELEYNIKSLNGFDNEFSNQVNTSLNTYSDIFMSKERIVQAKPSYNYEDNLIYFGNYGSATATKIKAFDESLTFKVTNGVGWKWISFPRMERYKDEIFEAKTLLSRIKPWDNGIPTPINLKLEYKPTGYDLSISYSLANGWENNPSLSSLQSTQGYKLKYEGNTNMASIRLEGAKEDYDATIDLVAGVNWIGYFIDQGYLPQQCFPANLWASLTQIQTQYWTMVKIFPNPPIWLGKPKPFQYGELVVLTTNHPYDNFQWQIPSGGGIGAEDIPLTGFYSFEEQADYLPFYVETDSTSDILEIAVLADGEVKGAAIREAGDTIVEVNGYLQGVAPGAIIEFDTWNGYKSEPIEKGNYIVIDHGRKIREKRNIYAGEKSSYYHVSLKSNELYDVPPEIGLVTCQPNPVWNNTTFTFRINEKSNITIRIFDLRGNPVKTLIDGYYPEGYYNLTWNCNNESGNHIQPGVYFYKVSSGNRTLQTDKIVRISTE